MATWQGYFVIERETANVNEANWVLLVDELDNIVGTGRSPHQILHKRGNLDMFNHGDEESPDWYSNSYIYVANFNSNAVSFDKFKNRLVNLFEVPEVRVTYVTSQRTIRNRPSVTAVYSLDGNERIAVELLGCASDSDLCIWGQSNAEVCGLLVQDAAEWDNEVQ